MSYTDINAETIDRWISDGWEWGQPISHEEYLAAKEGRWAVKLTPARTVPQDWFPPLAGKALLGLASGGGQQMPLFTAAGARCTVLDYSPRQIASEQAVAAREGYAITALRGDMTQPLPFPDESFDLIFHPVSNCYIRQVLPVWQECYRVLKKGGLLLAGLDNGINFIVDDAEKQIVHALPFDPLEDPALMAELQKGDDGVQFSHTAEEQLRGQLQAGFRLLDLFEDTNGSGRLHELNIPAFWATLARKD